MMNEVKRQADRGWRFTVRDVNGKRRNVKLNKNTTKKDAQNFKTMVLELVQTARFGQHFSPAQKDWFGSLDEKLAKKSNAWGSFLIVRANHFNMKKKFQLFLLM